ncbi:MAG: hypothetical protein HFE90_08865 [Firmicutes bacterium]|nr:hypothetical protein [Bacillota bacterium]
MVRIQGITKQNYYNNVQKKNTEQEVGKKAEISDVSAKAGKNSESQLSKKAQELLQRLRDTYDMDFVVADFDKGATADEVLSKCTKEFSVLFTSEELEKMASDEKYEKEYMRSVEQAIRMSEQINKEFGFGSSYAGNPDNAQLKKIGITVEDSGKITLFADFEKSGSEQQKRIDKVREEKRADKAAEKKRAEKDKRSEYMKGADDNKGVKRATIKANSVEELRRKLNELDWDSIPAEKDSKYNFTV